MDRRCSPRPPRRTCSPAVRPARRPAPGRPDPVSPRWRHRIVADHQRVLRRRRSEVTGGHRRAAGNGPAVDLGHHLCDLGAGHRRPAQPQPGSLTTFAASGSQTRTSASGARLPAVIRGAKERRFDSSTSGTGGPGVRSPKKNLPWATPKSTPTRPPPAGQELPVGLVHLADVLVDGPGRGDLADASPASRAILRAMSASDMFTKVRRPADPLQPVVLGVAAHRDVCRLARTPPRARSPRRSSASGDHPAAAATAPRSRPRYRSPAR